MPTDLYPMAFRIKFLLFISDVASVVIAQLDFPVTSVSLMITRAPNQISCFVSMRACVAVVSVIVTLVGLATIAAAHYITLPV